MEREKNGMLKNTPLMICGTLNGRKCDDDVLIHLKTSAFIHSFYIKDLENLMTSLYGALVQKLIQRLLEGEELRYPWGEGAHMPYRRLKDVIINTCSDTIDDVKKIEEIFIDVLDKEYGEVCYLKDNDKLKDIQRKYCETVYSDSVIDYPTKNVDEDIFDLD